VRGGGNDGPGPRRRFLPCCSTLTPAVFSLMRAVQSAIRLARLARSGKAHAGRHRGGTSQRAKHRGMKTSLGLMQKQKPDSRRHSNIVKLRLARRAAECAALQALREAVSRIGAREAFGVRRIPALLGASADGRAELSIAPALTLGSLGKAGQHGSGVAPTSRSFPASGFTRLTRFGRLSLASHRATVKSGAATGPGGKPLWESEL